MINKLILLTIALLTIASVGFCAPAGDYRLQPDDVIGMNVWQEADLSGKQFAITSEGNITVPYLNEVIKAQGLTQQELSNKIRDAYMKADVLVDPRVEITVISRHEMLVWVLGQVQRPGAQTFKDGLSLSSAIAQAGSFTELARLDAATLTRKSSKAEEPEKLYLKDLYDKGDLSKNISLQEGDVIYIPEDTVNRVYVLGEVNKPGLYRLKNNDTVLSAVSQAGGGTDRASLKATMLIRGDAKNPEKFVLDLNKLAKGNVAQDMDLKAGDVIYVPESPKPDWGKISQIINVISSFGMIRRYGLF